MDQSYDEWMRAVDQAVWFVAGVGVHDLADQNFRGMYADETPPEEAARYILNDEGFPA
jgi:hypothetical protein